MAFDGGASAVVSEVFTNAWLQAQLLTDQGKAAISAVSIAAGAVPLLPALPDIPVPAAPPTPTLTGTAFAPDTAVATQAAAVQALLTTAFSGFIATYYPAAVDANAQAWINRALTSGGSGINVTVEDQLWARDRARVLRDAARATDEATSAWLARGYSLPPGALIHQAAVIDREAAEKIGESSRERAGKSFDAELENVRTAVAQAVTLRGAALSAAEDYMRAVALGPQIGAQVAGDTARFYSAINDTLVRFYQAQSEVSLNVSRISTSVAELKERGYEAQLRADTEYMGHRVSAAVATAQMIGQQASAALNGLHASAAIAGTDSTTTSIQG